MRVLCIRGERKGQSGARTHGEQDGSPEIRIRWDLDGAQTMVLRDDLLAEDSSQAAQWIRDHDPRYSGGA
jgi:hypothetical protein